MLPVPNDHIWIFTSNEGLMLTAADSEMMPLTRLLQIQSDARLVSLSLPLLPCGHRVQRRGSNFQQSRVHRASVSIWVMPVAFLGGCLNQIPATLTVDHQGHVSVNITNHSLQLTRDFQPLLRDIAACWQGLLRTQGVENCGNPGRSAPAPCLNFESTHG
jgi:hypothetical protein